MTSPHKSDAHVYTWTVDNPRITIHIKREVIRGIHRDAMTALVSLRRRGAEAGGLLLGTAHRNSGLEISIEDYKPFESEHRFGPSYVLSDADKIRFEDILRRRKDDSGPQVVGFYRSHTRDGLALASEDLDLIQSCFPADTNAFLLIKPHAKGTSEASFFFWREENDREKSSFHEFPFHVSQGEHSPPAQVEQEADRAPMPSGRQIGLGLLAGIGVIATVIAAVVYFEPLKTEPTKASPPVAQRPVRVIEAQQPRTLGLSLAVTGNALWLRWHSDAVQKAERAVLHIQDAGARRQIELDRKQLEKGSVLYVPAGGDVTFEMQTVTPDAGAAGPSESIRYIRATPPDPPSPARASRAPVKQREIRKKPEQIDPPNTKARDDESSQMSGGAGEVTTEVTESARVQTPVTVTESTPTPAAAKPEEPILIEDPPEGPGVKGHIRNFGGKVRKLWPFGRKPKQPEEPPN